MKKKIEFSKLIFWIETALTAGTTLYACVLMWRTGDTAALPTLLSLAWGAYATATGFYFWKARKENEIKLLKANKIEISRQDITGQADEPQNGTPLDGTERIGSYE